MMDWDGCSGYHYSDSIIYGFSHTHLSGTGVADYCDILFMPYTGGAQLEPAEYASKFIKSKEKAEAGCYSVFLEKDRIKAEMTATERVGVHRYTFPGNRERGHILIDLRHRDEVLGSYMKRVNDREIEGYRVSKAWAKEQHVYFVARFSKPFFNSKILDMSKNPRETDPSIQGKAIVGLLDFYPENEPIVITVGISGTSIEGARKNLEAECAHFDFEKIKAETQAKWQRQLSKIEVEGGSDDQKTIFYTALYHTMIVPNIWNDVDGQYRGRDNKIHQASPDPSKGEERHDVYTVFSLWDTYRACNPLYTILEPKRTNDFIQTFLRQYEQGGLLPIWELSANETDCMIGNHAIPVIVDAYMKGIRDFDANLALEAMLKSANQDRYGMKWYRELGYIPADKEPESVSKTLEYAYDDWCISLMAKELGKDSIHEEFKRRSNYFMNIFDPATKFFRAKSNATWQEPFDPYEVNFNYTEANAWQYSLSAPQGLESFGHELLRIYGGQMRQRLDDLFSAKTATTGRNQADITGLIGQYVHGNEPSHHIAYLYNEEYRPWETQRLVRQIMDAMYSAKPDGLSGNEDCGQMSAWFVLSAMGFYPVTPGLPVYTLGTPLFERVTIHLDNGEKFVVEAPGVSKTKFYVEKASLGEKELYLGKFHHGYIEQGGKLFFEMSDKPTTRTMSGGFGMGLPIIVPVPFVAEGKRVFRDETTVELGCLLPEAVIFYTLDGSEPTENSAHYETPILLKSITVLKAVAIYKGIKSKLATAEFSKISADLRVHLYNCHYSPQYTGGGNQALADGIRGNAADFRTGGWQGFEGQDFNVEFDLGKSREINKLSAGFLQDENAWVFFPQKVRVEISDDGSNFTPAGEVVCNVAPTEKGVLQKDFALDLKGKKARYVRVVGVSLGQCPEWHKGAGHPCWVFADEVTVE
jgi:predicted alpha-1,2-mannosidase